MAEPWSEADLFAAFKRAWPYATCSARNSTRWSRFIRKGGALLHRTGSTPADATRRGAPHRVLSGGPSPTPRTTRCARSRRDARGHRQRSWAVESNGATSSSSETRPGAYPHRARDRPRGDAKGHRRRFPSAGRGPGRRASCRPSCPPPRRVQRGAKPAIVCGRMRPRATRGRRRPDREYVMAGGRPWRGPHPDAGHPGAVLRRERRHAARGPRALRLRINKAWGLACASGSAWASASSSRRRPRRGHRPVPGPQQASS